MAGKIISSEAQAALHALASGKIKVGWPDGNKTAVYATEQRAKRKRTGERTPSIKKPVSLALIARTLNYGREPGVTLEGVHYGRIPARPFMELAKRMAAKNIKGYFKKFFVALLSGRMTYEQFTAGLGQLGADCVKESMREGHWVPLSPRTIAQRRHGGAQPLIDTGTLINSVSFKVEK